MMKLLVAFAIRMDKLVKDSTLRDQFVASLVPIFHVVMAGGKEVFGPFCRWNASLQQVCCELVWHLEKSGSPMSARVQFALEATLRRALLFVPLTRLTRL